MRFLLLNTDYQAFLEQMYARQPGLAEAPYDEQMAARNATFFGVGDAYPRALRLRGHEGHDIHLNNAAMQAAWAADNDLLELSQRFRSRRLRLRRGIVPWIDRVANHGWLLDVFAAQVEHYRPDVILNHDISWMPPKVLRGIAGPDTLLVGQHAAPPYRSYEYTPYDLVVSSWPPTIERMRAVGVKAEHLPLGFDPAVLARLGHVERDLPVSFVGGLSEMHGARKFLVEALCEATPKMRVFAPSTAGLSRTSAIHRCYAGPAYGIDMFRVLARSEVTINHHGFPEPHANNMRLFEATGVGTLLLTDDKPDLGQYFEVGEEILTYSDAEDCLRQLRGLDATHRVRTAAAGQQRTLADHRWSARVDQLLAILARM